MSNKDEFAKVGFCFKTPAQLFIVFSHFGKLMIMPYHEFLNRPYISRIKARNFENPPIDIAKKSYDFITHVKAVRDGNVDQEKTGRHSDKVGEAFKEQIVKMHFDQIVSLYYHNLGVLRVNPISSDLQPKDYDKDHPEVFHKDYQLGKGFIIRSETTKDLKNNMDFK